MPPPDDQESWSNMGANPNDAPAPGDPAADAESETDRTEDTPVLSEVAMRINLLGKLIVPPAPH